MKNLFAFLTLFVLYNLANAQENQIKQDSIKVETLDEVLVSAVRVKEGAPVTFSNVTKEKIKKACSINKKPSK